jgi:hypothetical protein
MRSTAGASVNPCRARDAISYFSCSIRLHLYVLATDLLHHGRGNGARIPTMNSAAKMLPCHPHPHH